MGVSYRRSILGRHGRKVIALLCTWEVVALIPGSPIPTISQVVDEYPAVGVVLLVALGHHWFIETPSTPVVLRVGTLVS